MKLNNLGDMIIIITSQDKAEAGPDKEVKEEVLYYPSTRVFRYDFERPADNIESFIKHIEEHDSIIEGGQMGNI